MKNNLPIKEEKSFVSKIRRFFYKIKNIFFNHNENIETIDEEQNELSNENKINFKQEIHIDTKYEDKEKFRRKIEDCPELLGELSVERLRLLNNYYDEIIQKNEIKINKLKNVTQM